MQVYNTDTTFDEEWLWENLDGKTMYKVCYRYTLPTKK
jgi:hypothetical protein